MKLGFVGLGKMGANMVERLLRDRHQPVVFDRSPEAVAGVVAKGATGASSLEDLAGKLPGRKIVWIMVPSGPPVDQILQDFLPHLSAGDIVIDGGNSFYKESVRRAKELQQRGVHFLDCGTSGGIWGLKAGYCLMIGGDEEPFRTVEPIFSSLAPPEGYLHCGPSGSGHFVKMIHNGIEYGMMQAYAEGFDIMRASSFDLDLRKIAHVWGRGSVVRSWLLELVEMALAKDAKLESIEPFVPDSGEGRWTVMESINRDVPAPVLSLALQMRYVSRDKYSFSERLLAALRNEFGGHPVRLSRQD